MTWRRRCPRTMHAISELEFAHQYSGILAAVKNMPDANASVQAIFSQPCRVQNR